MTDLILLMWAFKYHNGNKNKRGREEKIERNRDRDRDRGGGVVGERLRALPEEEHPLISLSAGPAWISG